MVHLPSQDLEVVFVKNPLRHAVTHSTRSYTGVDCASRWTQKDVLALQTKSSTSMAISNNGQCLSAVLLSQYYAMLAQEPGAKKSLKTKQQSSTKESACDTVTHKNTDIHNLTHESYPLKTPNPQSVSVMYIPVHHANGLAALRATA